MLDWLKARLAEPSTHAALTGIAAAVVPLIPGPYALIAVAVFGALGFALPARTP